MRHIFGMAKSSLDLRGAKAQKLELDFLRLAYAVGYFRRQGVEAQGYLVVLAPDVKARVGAWIAKYGTEDAVLCIVPPITADDLDRLRVEKAENVEGMIAGSLGLDAERRSDANLGLGLGERCLRGVIAAHEPGIEELTQQPGLPLGIRWDFYGVLASD